MLISYHVRQQLPVSMNIINAEQPDAFLICLVVCLFLGK